jgi:CRISPR-associated protein Csb1
VNVFENLTSVPRLLLQASLKPAQGDRFQPTGFADLGAAVYERPDGKRMLLVESAQSVANRLELTSLNGQTGPHLREELQGVPYIVAKLTGGGDFETSSLIEAHRMNSPFIITNPGLQKDFCTRAKYAKARPLDWEAIARAFFFYDPNCLLHGAFMANLEDGRIKVPRALTGFIEAEDVREAASGGVKNNPFDPSGKLRAVDYPKDVYGNVPYHRMEFTASKITVYFNLDLALLDGYRLPSEAKQFLIAFGLLKIAWFLKAGLRLRTACDLLLEPAEQSLVTAPSGFKVPSERELLEEVQRSIKACASSGLFASPAVTRIETEVKAIGESSSSDAKPASDEDAED